MIMKNSTYILEQLDKLIPNPKCELDYNKDYELLIATLLSAQSTDKRVNAVTPVLFSKYNSLELLKDANISDLENNKCRLPSISALKGKTQSNGW